MISSVIRCTHFYTSVLIERTEERENGEQSEEKSHNIHL